MNTRNRTLSLAAAALSALLPLQSAVRADASPEPPASPPTASQAALAAIKAYGETLKGELMAAMQSGGPVTAIEVCKVRAPAIAEAVSREHDLDVHRVSLKNRNPANAPNAWQREVLLQFEQRRAAGEDPASLVWQDTVDTPEGGEFRLMKAIPTAGLCLGCHGEAMPEPVAEKIAALYPDDRATGFREGDIRGAFVVIERN
jgi:hypothetical protein